MKITGRSKSRGYRDGASDSRTPERSVEIAGADRSVEMAGEDLIKEKNKRYKLANMYKEESL